MPSSRRSTITLEQIKKNARHLERANALLSHKEALELAAREQGFPSFYAAQQAIHRSGTDDPTRNFLNHLTMSDIVKGVRAIDDALNEEGGDEKRLGDIPANRLLSLDAGDKFLLALNNEKLVELVALYWLGREDHDEPFGKDFDVAAYFQQLRLRALRMANMGELVEYLAGRWAYFGCFLMRALKLLCGTPLIADASPQSAQLYAACFGRH